MGNKVIKFLAKNWILILIFLLSLFLRTYKLNLYPDAIDEDEMSLGYISYSLLTNGTDEYGEKYPLYFKSVGDYKYGLYSYFSMLPIKLFGLNEFSTRVTSAFFGSLSVIAIYLLILEIFSNYKNKYQFSLISSFVLAITPIHIHFSRIGYSNIFGSFWTLVFILTFIRLIKNFNIKYLIFSLIYSLLAIYSYQAYRILVPLIAILTPLFYINELKLDKKNNNLIKKLIFIVAILLLVFVSFIDPKSRARANGIDSLINTPSLVENFSEDNIAGSKLITTRIFHNKLTIFTLDFIKRFATYIDPKLYFIDSADYGQRHGIQNIGLTLLIFAPFFLLGLVTLKNYLPLFLLLISPIPGSIVSQPVSTTRSVFIIYSLVIIISFGLTVFLENFKFNKILVILLSLLIFANFSFFIHQYTVHKVYHHPWYSDVGLKEMVLKVNNNINNYDKVVVSGGHYISFLFYNKKIDDKLIFNMPYDCPPVGKKNVLYVCFTYKLPRNGRLIDVIRYKDNQPAILLVDFQEKQIDKLPSNVSFGDESNVYKLDEKEYWPSNNLR